MREIEDQTSYYDQSCIIFSERSNETNFIKIIDSFGCYSEVGMQGREQVLSLNKTKCLNKGIIIHELMHSLGILFIVNYLILCIHARDKECCNDIQFLFIFYF
jgi:hypothetical protein